MFRLLPLLPLLARAFTGYPLALTNLGTPDSGVAEDYGGNAWTSGTSYGLKNGGKVYLVSNAKATYWGQTDYIRLDLRNKRFSFTANLKGVGCGVVATLYLLAMDPPGQGPSAPYCDIQPNNAWQPCFELDIMEANAHSFHSSLHAHQGTANDGSCNARIGCVANVGRYPFTPSGLETAKLYGPGAETIDTNYPFKVLADFDEEGSMSLQLRQGGRLLPIFNKSSAANLKSHPKPWDWKSYEQPGGIPPRAKEATITAFEKGLVFTSTLWAGDTHWLDDFSCQNKPHNNLAESWFTVGDLRVSEAFEATTSTTATLTSVTSTLTATSSTATTPTVTSTNTSTTTPTTTTTMTKRQETVVAAQWPLPDAPTLPPMATLPPMPTLPPLATPKPAAEVVAAPPALVGLAAAGPKLLVLGRAFTGTVALAGAAGFGALLALLLLRRKRHPQRGPNGEEARRLLPA